MQYVSWPILTGEQLSLLGPNWIEEVKRIVFGAYKRARKE